MADACDECLRTPALCKCSSSSRIPSTHSFASSPLGPGSLPTQPTLSSPNPFPHSVPYPPQHPSPYASHHFPYTFPSTAYQFNYGYPVPTHLQLPLPSPSAATPVPVPPRIAFQDETNRVTAEQANPKKTTKRKRSSNNASRKGRRTATSTTAGSSQRSNEAETEPAVYGVGPIPQAVDSTPQAFTDGTHFHSLLRQPRDPDQGRANSATHIWWFTRGCSTAEVPTTVAPVEEPSYTRPNPDKYPFLGCRLCR